MYDDLTKRMTAAEFMARAGRAPEPAAAPPSSPKQSSKVARFALGRLKTGEMNKTEAAYGAHLEQRRHAGEVLWFKFEGIKFRLADNTFYTPDYEVMLADMTLEIHEVKGFWQDDARVKIKVAAEIYPFKFMAVTAVAKKHGGGWKVEEF